MNIEATYTPVPPISPGAKDTVEGTIQIVNGSRKIKEKQFFPLCPRCAHMCNGCDGGSVRVAGDGSISVVSNMPPSLHLSKDLCRHSQENITLLEKGDSWIEEAWIALYRNRKPWNTGQ